MEEGAGSGENSVYEAPLTQDFHRESIDFKSKTLFVHTDVWLSQAQNVQEFGWLLHLPSKVIQLSFHRQQAV